MEKEERRALALLAKLDLGSGDLEHAVLHLGAPPSSGGLP
jgi:hypothetical protein